MRQLEASMIVANTTESLEIDGVGNVIAPESGVLAIGSGGLYAKSAALALVDVEGYDKKKKKTSNCYRKGKKKTRVLPAGVHIVKVFKTHNTP